MGNGYIADFSISSYSCANTPRLLQTNWNVTNIDPFIYRVQQDFVRAFKRYTYANLCQLTVTITSIWTRVT